MFFAIDTLDNAPKTFIAIAAIAMNALLSITLDFIWKRTGRARRRPPTAPGITPSG